MTPDILKFYAYSYGVVPKFPSTHFNVQFIQWQQMRQWCQEQGWNHNEDFIANSEFDKPWYFRTSGQQMWFTLRWS